MLWLPEADPTPRRTTSIPKGGEGERKHAPVARKGSLSETSSRNVLEVNTGAWARFGTESLDPVRLSLRIWYVSVTINLGLRPFKKKNANEKAKYTLFLIFSWYNILYNFFLQTILCISFFYVKLTSSKALNFRTSELLLKNHPTWKSFKEWLLSFQQVFFSDTPTLTIELNQFSTVIWRGWSETVL